MDFDVGLIDGEATADLPGSGSWTCMRPEPDLFWAVRGGGGNFGIATSLEYDLHPVGPTVIGGPIIYPIERPVTCSNSSAAARDRFRTSTRCSHP